ncbi:MAG: hypothetical protein LC737_06070 [Chloroflexi bacterium]|nr:hypothetical protein [Chloroflexota bacterium]
MTTLHVQLLGEFRLLADDCPLTTVNTPRAQALLTYLVLHRGVPQARQHIAFQFWPDSTEAQARTNLRNVFHSLRRALPDAEAFLDADAKSLLWRANAPFTLDVQAFEHAATRGLQLAVADEPAAIRHLQSAATRYRGDLLPSCYDEWIAPERERLRQLLITTLERLSELLTQQHDWQRAIHAAEQRLRHDPLHEETYRRLLNLHTQNADRVGVLRTYRTCAAVLASELGVEPSASTQRAYEQSLRGDISGWRVLG